MLQHLPAFIVISIASVVVLFFAGSWVLPEELEERGGATTGRLLRALRLWGGRPVWRRPWTQRHGTRHLLPELFHDQLALDEFEVL